MIVGFVVALILLVLLLSASKSPTSAVVGGSAYVDDPFELYNVVLLFVAAITIMAWYYSKKMKLEIGK